MPFDDESDDEMRRQSGRIQFVYVMLFREIVSHQLDGPIALEDLTSRFDVSLAQAAFIIHRLWNDKLLVHDAITGVSVRNVSLKDYVPALDLRELLEGEAAWRAAGRVPQKEIALMRDRLTSTFEAGAQVEVRWRLDEDFHDMATDRIDNPSLSEVLRGARAAMWLFRPFHNAFERLQSQSRVRQVYEEHMAILDALERVDAEGARIGVLAHLKGNARLKIGSSH